MYHRRCMKSSTFSSQYVWWKFILFIFIRAAVWFLKWVNAQMVIYWTEPSFASKLQKYVRSKLVNGHDLRFWCFVRTLCMNIRVYHPWYQRSRSTALLCTEKKYVFTHNLLNDLVREIHLRPSSSPNTIPCSRTSFLPTQRNHMTEKVAPLCVRLCWTSAMVLQNIF